jgi:hypothetical protein
MYCEIKSRIAMANAAFNKNRALFASKMDFLLQQVIEGKIKGGIEVTGRRGRRRRKLLDDLKEMGVYSHLKQEARFGPVVRQTAK